MTLAQLILIIAFPIIILLFLAYRNLFKVKSDEQSDYLQNKRNLNISIAQEDINEIVNYTDLLTKSQHLSLKHAEEMLEKIENLAAHHAELLPTVEIFKRKINNLKFGLGYPRF